MENEPLRTAHLPDDTTDAHLKAVHGPLTLVELPEEKGSPALAFVLKRPDMKVLGAFASIAQKDPANANTTLVKSCTVWATDMGQLDSVPVFLAVLSAASKLLDERTATVKNL